MTSAAAHASTFSTARTVPSTASDSNLHSNSTSLPAYPQQSASAHGRNLQISHTAAAAAAAGLNPGPVNSIVAGSASKSSAALAASEGNVGSSRLQMSHAPQSAAGLVALPTESDVVALQGSDTFRRKFASPCDLGATVMQTAHTGSADFLLGSNSSTAALPGFHSHISSQAPDHSRFAAGTAQPAKVISGRYDTISTHTSPEVQSPYTEANGHFLQSADLSRAPRVGAATAAGLPDYAPGLDAAGAMRPPSSSSAPGAGASTPAGQLDSALGSGAAEALHPNLVPGSSLAVGLPDSAPGAGATSTAGDPLSDSVGGKSNAAEMPQSALEMGEHFLDWQMVALLRCLKGPSSYLPLPEGALSIPPYPGCVMKKTGGQQRPVMHVLSDLQLCRLDRRPWGGIADSFGTA